MITLHRYVLRELLKTFGLALAGMTALFTMAGGIYNVVAQEGVGPAEVFVLLPLLIPVFITFTMPLAALFAATIVYGRLAADNELTACRAAGINVHRIFRSALLLAVFVALFSLVFVNFVIPDMLGRMRSYIRGNLCALAEQRLKTSGYIRYHAKDSDENYLVTANSAATRFDPDDLRAHGWDPQHSYLAVESPCFLQLDKHGEVVRFTSAAGGWVEFNTLTEPVEITAIVTDARDYTVDEHVAHIDQQTIGPIPAALPLKPKPSLQSLTELIALHADPWKFPDLAKGRAQFVGRLVQFHFLDYARRELADHRALRLRDDANQPWRLFGQIPPIADRPRLDLTNVRIERPSAATDEPTLYTAPAATVRSLRPLADCVPLQIELIGTREDPVRLSHPGSAVFGDARERQELDLEGLTLDADIMQQVRAAAPQWLDPNRPPPLDEPLLTQARTKLLSDLGEFQREVVSLFHFRFGFGVSALATVIMGAALGVAFRGGRALAAFGLASIPFGVVFVVLVAGRQTAEKPGTELLGAAIIWGGLLIVGLGDAVLLRLGVRR